MRVPFFLLFSFNKETQKQKRKKCITGVPSGLGCALSDLFRLPGILVTVGSQTGPRLDLGLGSRVQGVGASACENRRPEPKTMLAPAEINFNFYSYVCWWNHIQLG